MPILIIIFHYATYPTQCWIYAKDKTDNSQYYLNIFIFSGSTHSIPLTPRKRLSLSTLRREKWWDALRVVPQSSNKLYGSRYRLFTVSCTWSTCNTLVIQVIRTVILVYLRTHFVVILCVYVIVEDNTAQRELVNYKSPLNSLNSLKNFKEAV